MPSGPFPVGEGWAGLPPGPLVMGILNVTPDSFSDGGAHFDPGRAIEAGRTMVRDGAAILDIGGESTRPGAATVPAAEERRRILPVIAGLAAAGVPISVDTRNAGTMARALDAGAAIINDVSALSHDPAAAALVAERRCPVILMHMRGTPATMMGLARYGDVAAEVVRELQTRLDAACSAGIDPAQIAVDPGFGFAKTRDQSHELLRRLDEVLTLGRPVVAGLSRKAFVGGLAAAADPAMRDAASIAANIFAVTRGARILRVHDVAATVQALRVWQALAA